jgi:hypothetical protein
MQGSFVTYIAPPNRVESVSESCTDGTPESRELLMIPPVQDSDCKLLDAPNVVAQYVAVRQVLQSLSDQLPAYLEREDLKEVCVALEKLHGRITQDRFRIGFIGVSQAGKSTTAGYVLGATGDNDNPAPPGGDAKAATAIATRIIPVSKKPDGCLPGEEHRVELVFMTTRQLRDRVQQFADILALDYEPNSSFEDVLRKCEDRRQRNPHDGIEDCDAAIRLLTAATAYPANIKPAPVIKQGSFDLEERRKYVIHPDVGGQINEYALLSELRIWFNTQDAPETLEVIDLPGLGVKRASDESLTIAFLPELNGAFLFQEQQQVEGESAAKLTTRMRKEYGSSIGGRVWMVVTKGDLLAERDFTNATGKFKTISDELRKAGFAQQNLVIVSNPFYSLLKSGLTRAEAWSKTKPKCEPAFDGSGDPIIPAAIEAHPAFREAYVSLVTEGGVPRICRLMKEHVVDALRKETQSEARSVLVRSTETIRSILASSRQMGGMTHEQIESAAMAGMELDTLMRHINRSDEEIRPIYEQVRESLFEIQEKMHDPVEGPLPESARTLTRLFVQRCERKAEELTRPYVTDINKRVRQITSQCSASDVTMIRDALEQWEIACKSIVSGVAESGLTFRSDITGSFLMGDDLTRKFWTERGDRPSPDDYFEMMRSKIDCVSQLYAAQLATTVAASINRLARAYRSVGNEQSAADPAQVGVLDYLIAQLPTA